MDLYYLGFFRNLFFLISDYQIVYFAAFTLIAYFLLVNLHPLRNALSTSLPTLIPKYLFPIKHRNNTNIFSDSHSLCFLPIVPGSWRSLSIGNRLFIERKLRIVPQSYFREILRSSLRSGSVSFAEMVLSHFWGFNRSK